MPFLECTRICADKLNATKEANIKRNKPLDTLTVKHRRSYKSPPYYPVPQDNPHKDSHGLWLVQQL